MRGEKDSCATGKSSDFLICSIYAREENAKSELPRSAFGMRLSFLFFSGFGMMKGARARRGDIERSRWIPRNEISLGMHCAGLEIYRCTFTESLAVFSRS